MKRQHNYRQLLETSRRVNWSLEDLIGEGRGLPGDAVCRRNACWCVQTIQRALRSPQCGRMRSAGEYRSLKNLRTLAARFHILFG